MKKTIIITIFTALLTMTTMLSSCSTGNLKITDILNKNYNKSTCRDLSALLYHYEKDVSIAMKKICPKKALILCTV